jgi:transposase-like protein
MSEHFSHDVEALRKAVALVREQAGGRRCRFPASVRAQAVSLLNQGASAASVARKAGLRVDVVQRWARRAGGGLVPRPTPNSTKPAPRRAVRPAPRVFAVEAAAKESLAATEPPPAAGPPLRLQVGAFVVTVSLATGVI